MAVNSWVDILGGVVLTRYLAPETIMVFFSSYPSILAESAALRSPRQLMQLAAQQVVAYSLFLAMISLMHAGFFVT